MRMPLPSSPSGPVLFRLLSSVLAIFIAAQSVFVVVAAEAAGPGDADTVRAAIEAMNTAFYNETTGLWDTGPWWHSGVALRAVAEYMLSTGSHEYTDLAAFTVDTQRAPLDWWTEGGGDFRADSTDDTGWWALALTALYEATGNTTYLDIARLDEAYMYDYWNTSICGGGLIWSIPHPTYHNAISNELYLELTATLHNLIPGDTYYLSQARKEWEWFKASGMINAQGLVNDGLTEDSACVNNGYPVWTYNQGVVLSGLVQLAKAVGTGEEGGEGDDEAGNYLDIARSIADAVIADEALSPGGILNESACKTAKECEPNGSAFKGVFVRGLAKLDKALGGEEARYAEYIKANAQSAYEKARDEATGLYGFYWQGGEADVNGTVGKQVAAVDLLLAAL